MPRFIFHLIGNAHLDPVWLWDWREGHEEAVSTCRTILDLMDEDRELTFSRGEASIYAYLAEHDPATFKRILRRIKEGRWEVVGGTWVQADTNLPAAETFARLYHLGQDTFRRLFGAPTRVAWAADSFGHAAGLPEVMVRAGIDGFAFTRPDAGRCPIGKPAFWWQAPSGARVLAYRPAAGWYGCERDEMPRRLDGALAEAGKCDLVNVGIFYGLGNHGGGPTRRQIADIRTWAKAHPEVEVRFSGMQRLLDAIRGEMKGRPKGWIPTHQGELGFVLRGCYASMAKLKTPFRHAENELAQAECADSLVRAKLGGRPADLSQAWQGLLFNSFHDILPGSSIERAYDDQLAWLGGVRHRAQAVQHAALAALARRVDTQVAEPPADHPRAVPMLVWNPLPRAVKTLVELEASLDWRPLWAYKDRPEQVPLRVRGADGKDLPFQEVETEHRCFPHLPWRKRVLVPLTLPAGGWSVVEFGWVEGAAKPKAPAGAARADGGHAIDNGIFRIEAEPGAAGIRVLKGGKPFLGGDGLQARLDEDPYGSWGGMGEEPESFKDAKVRERWTVAAVAVRESGPERASLWVRLAGARSRLDLTLSLVRGRAAVDIAARAFVDERSARLRLALPAGSDRAEYAVPAATVERDAVGEVPGGRWVRCGGVGFASDALYSFHTAQGELAATVCRASRYADDRTFGPEAELWRPAADSGELRFRALLAGAGADLPALAEELERPAVTLPVAVKAGDLPRQGSLLELAPASLRLLALKPAADGRGLVLRVQNEGAAAVAPKAAFLGRRLALGRVAAGAIATWRLTPGKAGWTAAASDLTEG